MVKGVGGEFRHAIRRHDRFGRVEGRLRSRIELRDRAFQSALHPVDGERHADHAR